MVTQFSFYSTCKTGGWSYYHLNCAHSVCLSYLLRIGHFHGAELLMFVKHCCEPEPQVFGRFPPVLCLFNPRLPVTQRADYPGHDWLASTVFLIMAGDVDRSLGFLLSLSSLLTSAFIWPARIHASVSRAISWKYAAKLPLANTAKVWCIQKHWNGSESELWKTSLAAHHPLCFFCFNVLLLSWFVKCLVMIFTSFTPVHYDSFQTEITSVALAAKH